MCGYIYVYIHMYNLVQFLFNFNGKQTRRKKVSMNSQTTI